MPQAALAARARQQLALTIARWTAVFDTSSVLLKLDAQLLTSASNTSLATNLLAKIVALAHLTAKTSIQLTAAEGGGSFAAAAASKETLGATAAAWSQLPWPVGSTQLLRMAVSAAARVAVLEAMASSAGQPAFDAWQTAGRIVDAVTQALQQADLPVRSLPQAAFGPTVAATLSADAESHAGRGAVAVATALLIRAAGAVQTESMRSVAREAGGASGVPTGAAHGSAKRADRSGGVVGRASDGPGKTLAQGNLRQTSSSHSSSSGSGASSDSSGSSSGNSASSGSTSQSSDASSSGTNSATSGSMGPGSSSADSQQRRGKHKPGQPGGQAEVVGPATARMQELNTAHIEVDGASAAATGTGTVQAGTAGPDIAADAGRGGGLTGEGAADSSTEAESGEIGLAEHGAASPSSSASGSSSSSVSSGSGSSSSRSSSALASSGSESARSSGGRHQPPARQRGPQTAMEARATFEAVLRGSQDR